MRRWIMMSIWMAAVMPIAAQAAPDVAAVPTPPALHKTQEVAMEKGFQRIVGTVTEATADRIHINGNEGEWIAHLKQTLICDAKTGERVNHYPQKGDTVAVFLQHNKPVMLSYPAQMTPDLVVLHPHDGTYQVDMDYFDRAGEGVSHRLVLNHLPNHVTDQFGRLVEQDQVLGQNLIVWYRMSTRSLPPQTNPEKVMVYADIRAELASDVVDEDGNQMYGLRHLAERLGATVEWNEAERSVVLGGTITAKVKVDKAELEMKDTVTPLTIRPIIREGHVYVGDDVLQAILPERIRK